MTVGPKTAAVMDKTLENRDKGKDEGQQWWHGNVAFLHEVHPNVTYIYADAKGGSKRLWVDLVPFAESSRDGALRKMDVKRKRKGDKTHTWKPSTRPRTSAN